MVHWCGRNFGDCRGFCQRRATNSDRRTQSIDGFNGSNTFGNTFPGMLIVDGSWSLVGRNFEGVKIEDTFAHGATASNAANKPSLLFS